MRPIYVSDLILDVSFYLRITPDLATLNSAVQRLIEESAIGEVSEGSYVDGRSAGGSGLHQPISDDTYRAALAQHLAGHRTDPGPPVPSEPALIATIPTAGREPNRSEWRQAEAIAIELVESLRLQGRRAAVPSIRSEPGQLTFVLFATANDDPGRIHRLAVPVFDAAAGPRSQLRPITVPLP